MQHIPRSQRQIFVEETSKFTENSRVIEETVLEAMELERKAQEAWEKAAFLQTANSRILMWLVNNDMDKALEKARATYIGETEENPIDVDEFSIE